MWRKAGEHPFPQAATKEGKGITLRAESGSTEGIVAGLVLSLHSRMRACQRISVSPGYEGTMQTLPSVK